LAVSNFDGPTSFVATVFNQYLFGRILQREIAASSVSLDPINVSFGSSTSKTTNTVCFSFDTNTSQPER
jgi:hypothetical protein